MWFLWVDFSASPPKLLIRFPYLLRRRVRAFVHYVTNLTSRKCIFADVSELWILLSLVSLLLSSSLLPSTTPGLGHPSMCILDFIENECHICILLKMQIAGFKTLKTFFLVFLKHDFLEETWEDADYLIMFIWEILVPCFWLFWFSLEFSREQIG